MKNLHGASIKLANHFASWTPFSTFALLTTTLRYISNAPSKPRFILFFCHLTKSFDFQILMGPAG